MRLPQNNELDYLGADNQFSTYDLGLATALISVGFELWGLDKNNAKKVLFIFKQSPEIIKVGNDYWADKLEINARTLFDNQKMLKNRIYSA